MMTASTRPLTPSDPSPRSVGGRPWRVLLACNRAQDRTNVSDLLSRARRGRYEVEWAPGYGAALKAVTTGCYDVLIIDERLDTGLGANLLREAVDSRAAAPAILLVDADDSRASDWAAEAGAADCLARSEMTPALLERAIRYAVETRRIEARMRQLADYDQLTGLANRSLFRDTLNRAIARARRGDGMVGLMLLGLDRFKLINETLGHEAGDGMLRSVTARVADCVGGSDLLARFGSDEFAVILADIATLDDAARVADRIAAAMSRSFEIAGHEIFVTMSIGIATYPLCGWDADSLSNCANTAMHRAKELGRNAYQFYTRKMTARELERLVLQTSLHHALERREFTLYYQPQVELESGRVIGVEALLRWLHPEFGVLSPEQFVPIAEETGLIVPLGEWVIETACRQCRTWQDDGLPPLRVAVNISPRQFAEPRLGNTIAAALAQSGLAANHLALELTEGTLMEDTAASSTTLARFRNMGLHLAIDDFGTGYSSLGYLNRFPLDALKIDKSFVAGIGTDANGAAIVTAIIGLAHNLGLGVVAEGVETRTQLDFLRTHGCDTIQGHIPGRPVPADDFSQMLNAGDGPRI